MRLSACLFTLLIVAPATLFSLEETAAPAVMMSRCHSIPDFTQTDPEGEFTDGGSVYCAPVSVSNSLIWLGENGFPKLIPSGKSAKAKQIALIRTLARGMGTKTSANGTGTAELIIGVRNYVADCGYTCRRLEYEGWRGLPSGMKRHTGVPELNWIKARFCEPTGTVWLNVGWYKYHSATNQYVRFGGHWLTMVGYGVDEHGHPDARCVTVHDPSPRAGTRKADNVILLDPIVTGQMVTDEKRGSARSAVGYHKIRSSVRLAKGADFGILDGAVVMALEPAAH